MHSVNRATVQIDVLLLGLAFCSLHLGAATVLFAALVKASGEAFCDKVNAKLAVGVHSVDEHCQDERWSQCEVPIFSQVCVFASEWNPIENRILGVGVHNQKQDCGVEEGGDEDTGHDRGDLLGLSVIANQFDKVHAHHSDY
jgi:hypothetical protein